MIFSHKSTSYFYKEIDFENSPFLRDKEGYLINSLRRISHYLFISILNLGLLGIRMTVELLLNHNHINILGCKLFLEGDVISWKNINWKLIGRKKISEKQVKIIIVESYLNCQNKLKL